MRPATRLSLSIRHHFQDAEEPHSSCTKHAAADVSCSFLNLHEEIFSKHPMLIWRVLRHFLTSFPLLNNLVVLEAKDVYERDPRTTRREPNSSVNCYQICVFKGAHRLKFLVGEFGRIFLHRS